MKNNFTYSASIKLKDLEKMEKAIDLLYSEKLDNDDLHICVAFRNLLDGFDGVGYIKMYDLIDKFADFYQMFLRPWCKGKIVCENFEEFDFEQVQYIMDKMKEVISIIYGEYGL